MAFALIVPVHVRRAGAPQLLFGGGLPAELAELSKACEPSEVLPLWRELRKCYPSERAALDAAKKQPLIVLPFFNTAENIRLCNQILREQGFSEAERVDIVVTNPGVLANKPYDLANSSPDEIRDSVKFVARVESIPEPIRLAIPSVTAVTIVAFIAKRLSECAGGTCG